MKTRRVLTRAWQNVGCMTLILGVMLLLFIGFCAGPVDSQEPLPRGVSEFRSGDVVCHTVYSEGVSCVPDAQPASQPVFRKITAQDGRFELELYIWHDRVNDVLCYRDGSAAYGCVKR